MHSIQEIFEEFFKMNIYISSFVKFLVNIYLDGKYFIPYSYEFCGTDGVLFNNNNNNNSNNNNNLNVDNNSGNYLIYLFYIFI